MSGWGRCGGSVTETVRVLLVVALQGVIAFFPELFPGAVVDFGG